jgi:hypothetical protein
LGQRFSGSAFSIRVKLWREFLDARGRGFCGDWNCGFRGKEKTLMKYRGLTIKKLKRTGMWAAVIRKQNGQVIIKGKARR